MANGVVSTAHKTTAGKPVSKALRVLIYSASSLTRAGVERLLESRPGIAVTQTLATSRELLPAIAAHDADVVLAHVESGEQAEQLLTEVSAHEIPVVLLLESTGSRNLAAALTLGAKAILLASPSSGELAAAIYSAAVGLISLSGELVESLASVLRSGSGSVASADPYDPDYPERLTAREHEVLEMMMEGLSNKKIAARLNVSTHTVKFHISSILGKLGAASRTEATTIGLRRGLITI